MNISVKSYLDRTMTKNLGKSLYIKTDFECSRCKSMTQAVIIDSQKICVKKYTIETILQWTRFDRFTIT